MEKGRLPKSLYTPAYDRFLAELRKARTAAGLTQVEASDRLGRPQSFISNCESGERRVDLVEFLAFCRLYGIDPCKVIHAVDEHVPMSKAKPGKKRR
jgi:transcriptional regulator with XRE-family HTH domain